VIYRNFLITILMTFVFQSSVFAINNKEAQKALNHDYQMIWKNLSPKIEKRILAEFDKQINISLKKINNKNIEIIKVNAPKLDLKGAPGFGNIGDSRFTLYLPNKSRWGVKLTAKIRIKKKILGFNYDKIQDVTINIKKMRIFTNLDFDGSDQSHMLLKRFGRPVVEFGISLKSSDTFANILLKLASPLIKIQARKAINKTLKNVVETQKELIYSSNNIPGINKNLISSIRSSSEMETIVKNQDHKMRKNHLPYGTLLRAIMSEATSTSANEAFGEEGNEVKGKVLNHTGEGDSAIWTGHYLAAMSYRYAVTGDLESLSDVRHALSGVGRLIDVNGATGLLARFVAPLDSSIGKRLVKNNEVFRKKIMNDGKEWGSYQGHNGVSRDQYIGTLYGLSVVHDLVGKDHQDIKKECALRVKQMLDYLISKNWFVSEDRPDIAKVGGKSMPTFWLGVGQKITWLLVGNHMFPGRYDKELKEVGKLTKTGWIAEWTSVLDPYASYYKYNLNFMKYYMYFKYETSPERRENTMRSYRMIERATRHHLNVHFNNIRIAIEPSKLAELKTENNILFNQFLNRSHKLVPSRNVDLSDIEWIKGKHSSVKDQIIPKYPLQMEQRHYSGFFMWQRSPFQPVAQSTQNTAGTLEKPGIDASLPYWMGRYLGVF